MGAPTQCFFFFYSNIGESLCTVTPDNKGVCVLLCFINPRVMKIRHETSSCPGIFSRTLRFYCDMNMNVFSNDLFGLQFGRAASGRASAPQPPRATGVGPLSHAYISFPGWLCLRLVFFPLFFSLFLRSDNYVRSQILRKKPRGRHLITKILENQTQNRDYTSVGTLVRLLWRAGARRLQV